jgi:hypothetical protein
VRGLATGARPTRPRGRGRLTLIALGLLLGLAATGSCALASFNRVPGSTSTSTTGGGAAGAGGATSGSGATTAAPCEPATYPAAPSVVDAGGDIEIVAAVHQIFLVSGKDGGGLGLDLDKQCTCHGGEPTCVSTKKNIELEAYCDDEQGRDNAMRAMIELLGQTVGEADLGAYYSDLADQGRWSMLWRIRGYNGEPDDDRVSVAAITALGFGAPTEPPKWDGTDVWRVSATSFEDDGKGKPDLERPRYVDEQAFVVSGMVVASLPATEVVMGGSLSQLAIRATGGGMMARLEQGDGGWAMRDGVITGRLGLDEVFAAIGSFRSDTGMPICTSNPFYATGKTLFCNAPDILKGLGSPTQPCDAVSLGIGFEADPALVGAAEPPPVPGTSCEAGTDPTDDTCPPGL